MRIRQKANGETIMFVIWNLTIRNRMKIYCILWKELFENWFKSVKYICLSLSVSLLVFSIAKSQWWFNIYRLLFDYICIHVFNIYWSSPARTGKYTCYQISFIWTLKLHILININLFQLMTFMKLLLALTDA